MQNDQCLFCVHYLGDWKCEAFEDGIPIQIIEGEHDHSQPFEGDNGIQYKRIPRKVIQNAKRSNIN